MIIIISIFYLCKQKNRKNSMAFNEPKNDRIRQARINRGFLQQS